MGFNDCIDQAKDTFNERLKVQSTKQEIKKEIKQEILVIKEMVGLILALTLPESQTYSNSIRRRLDNIQQRMEEL